MFHLFSRYRVIYQKSEENIGKIWDIWVTFKYWLKKSTNAFEERIYRDSICDIVRINLTDIKDRIGEYFGGKILTRANNAI